jgi:hypothetical protein
LENPLFGAVLSRPVFLYFSFPYTFRPLSTTLSGLTHILCEEVSEVAIFCMGKTHKPRIWFPTSPSPSIRLFFGTRPTSSAAPPGAHSTGPKRPRRRYPPPMGATHPDDLVVAPRRVSPNLARLPGRARRRPPFRDRENDLVVAPSVDGEAPSMQPRGARGCGGRCRTARRRERYRTPSVRHF